MWFARAIPAVVFGVFAATIAIWLRGSADPYSTSMRLPGDDLTGVQQSTTTQSPIDLSGAFTAGPGVPSKLAGEWLAFRGANRDAISSETTPLLTTFDNTAPPRKWEITLGEGYAGPAISSGRVYLLDYDAVSRADVLRCLSLDDGAEIWRRAYDVDVKRNHGMSRTVPAVSDTHVVTMGPKCHVLCVDSTTGEYRWGIDLVRQYRTKVPPWYAGQCPLIDDGRAIIAPGGKSLMIAVNCTNGEVIWETPNPRGWEMTHTSIMPMEFGGVRMYVYCGSGGVAGVDAETGKLLWETTAWRVKIAAVPSPVNVGDGRIFLSGGYEAGSMMIRLLPSGDGFNVETLWSTTPQVFGAEQQTPIFHRNHIFGVIPGGQMVCLDPATGKQRWNSGTQRFGIGPYLVANDVIYATSDTGTLSAIAADPQEYRRLGSTQAIDHGHEAWGPMALAGGQLLIRDLTRMVCLDLRGEAQ